MRWKFWQQKEERNQPYSDAIVSAIMQSAGRSADELGGSTGVAEACASLWGRAFASATVSPANMATAALTPTVLELIGRQLHSNGEVVFDIVVGNGGVSLQSAASWTVSGIGSWDYELNIPQPSGNLTRFRPADAVLHLRYAAAPGEPWIGVGPLQRASTTDRLAKAAEIRLAQELNMPTGSVLPVPDTTSTVSGKLQADIKALAGDTILVPMTTGGWDQQATTQFGANDWVPRRIGANPPAVLEQIRQGVAGHVAAASGVPATLLATSADGTGLREAWRQFLHGTIQPIADIVSEGACGET